VEDSNPSASHVRAMTPPTPARSLLDQRNQRPGTKEQDMTGHGQEEKTVLVLDGTGKTGGRIVPRLQDRGRPVRVGTPSGTPPFDWNDQAGWPAALDGVGSVYVSYYPDLAMPGAPEAVEAFAGLAMARGVRRLVLLSGRGEEEAQRAEQVLQRSGADWTIVRSAWFAQNFSESYMLESLRAGELALPAGPVGEPFVDAEDIAEVATAALTEDGHVGQLYEVTGPRLLSFADAVLEIAQAAGRELGYRQLPLEEFTADLKEAQVPAEFVWLLTYLFSEVLDGRNAHLGDGFQRALGRPPRDFADYAREAAATGAWDA
jgi:uncharacterized protein YbjT (DUF2867 family)